MKLGSIGSRHAAIGAALFILVILQAPMAGAHCDTMDGPVVADARRALDAGDIAPVLKWIPAASEPGLRAAFGDVMRVRALGADARALADLHFFETLVRIHRAGEGEPYEGLKPAGSIDPVIAAADRSLASGSIEELSGELASSLRAEIEARFAEAARLKAGSENSPEAGRRFVEAYVAYMHFVESAGALAGHAGAHAEPGTGARAASCGHHGE